MPALDNKSEVPVLVQDPVTPVNWFQQGENQAIALASERGYWLLIDDSNPYHLAKSRGIRVFGTPDFVIVLYDQGRLSYENAQIALQAMQVSKHLRREAMGLLANLAHLKGDR